MESLHQILGVGEGIILAVFFLISLLVGMFVWWKYGVDENLDEQDLFDAGFLSLVWFFVFARVGYVITNYREIGGIFGFFRLGDYGGLNYVIGFIGVIVTLILVSRANEWKVWKLLDLFAMSASAMISIYYLGSFLRLANPGIQLSWGMYYPVGVRVFPVDLLGFLWFTGSYHIVRRVRANFRFYSWYKSAESVANDGLAFLVLGLTVGLYYVIRNFVDYVSVKILGIGWMLVMGLVIVMVSCILIYIRSGRRLSEDFQFLKNPKDAKFKDPGLRRKASLLKLRRKKKKDED